MWTKKIKSHVQIVMQTAVRTGHRRLYFLDVQVEEVESKKGRKRRKKKGYVRVPPPRTSRKNTWKHDPVTPHSIINASDSLQSLCPPTVGTEGMRATVDHSRCPPCFGRGVRTISLLLMLMDVVVTG